MSFYPTLNLNVREILSDKKPVYNATQLVQSGFNRSFRGIGNNMKYPTMGVVGTSLMRKAGVAYNDGVSTLAQRGSNPSPRTVSNHICKNTVFTPNSLGLTDMTWMWGQFLDHEVGLTPSQSGGETADILTVVEAEEDFPNRTISFRRSIFEDGSNPRQQKNEISSYVDATNVYGFSESRAYELRTLDGTGKMKTTLDDHGHPILIYNTKGLENETHGGNPEDFFLAGDVRSNENVSLTSMHTLFVREHNHHCDEIVLECPELAGNDEAIYQYARNIVIGEMQSITYNEFIPALIGPTKLPPYRGYKNNVQTCLHTEFSTVGYRIGHTMLSGTLKVGTSGTLALRDGFFTPTYIQENGIDDLLLGGCLQTMQEIDGQIIDDVRNFLFMSPTADHLLDLAAINIQRARDHGIPDYNTLREAYGLNRVTSFSQITSNVDVQNKLSALYDSVDVIDPWVGGIVEDHVTDSAVGPLFTEILKDQFTRLRDGDRFWYEINPSLSQETVRKIKETRLSDIIIRNCDSINVGDIPDNVFGR